MKPTVAQLEFKRSQLRRKLNAQTFQQNKFDAETERMVKEIKRTKNKTK
jgi:hypothetical protein